MDEIVKQGMAKWPNVPAVYGWLSLDRRGNWLIKGERIANPIVADFIGRNYEHDDKGRWFFQNGPQRVYVNLEATPYIARSDPQHGFVLQTGAPLEQIEQVYWCDDGMLILRHGDIVAQVDDRDLSQVLDALHVDGQVASNDDLLDWLELHQGSLTLLHAGKHIAVQPLRYDAVPQTFDFQPVPQADQD